MDGSVSTLAPIFAAAGLTGRPLSAFFVGLAASLGAAISMGLSEALSDDGSVTGRGGPIQRGAITGVATGLGGMLHTFPFLIPVLGLALKLAYAVVVCELIAIAFIRYRFMGGKLVSTVVQVVIGGGIVLAIGVWLGLIGASLNFVTNRTIEGEFVMKVGFIGLGHMGSGMAANLLKAGHQVTVYNRTPAKVEPLVAQGAKAAARVADACRGDAIVTMLANDEAAASVTLGEGGIIASLPKGAIHISSSTISVALSEALANAHGKVGQRFVAAPVFGRPEAAAAGRLFVIAAGSPAAIETARPLFDAIGQKTFVVSETPETANLVKLSGNFLTATVIESLGEAIALVSKGGVDVHQYLDILSSTLFGAPAYKTYGALIADRKFEPAGFAAPLAQKDIRLVLAAAEDLRVPLPVANLLRDRFLTLLAHGGEKLDWSAIGQLAAKDAGEVWRN